MSRKTRRVKARRLARPRTVGRRTGVEDRGEIVELAAALLWRPETGPALAGGDVDADWMRAHDCGEEAVGGSVATPDQDVVDELGRALGLTQAPDAEVRAAEEILRDRERFRWHLERDMADEEEGRLPRRRRAPA